MDKRSWMRELREHAKNVIAQELSVLDWQGGLEITSIDEYLSSEEKRIIDAECQKITDRLIKQLTGISIK